MSARREPPDGVRARRPLAGALLALVAEGLLSRFSFGIITFALPLYARRMGMSLAEVSILVTLNSAVAIALKPAMGWAADRFGLKRALLLAVALRSAVSLLLGFAAAPWELYSIRALHGLSAALRDPAAAVLVAEQGGKDRVASAFAWYHTAKSLAGSLSKALAGFLLAWTAGSYPAVFLVAFVLSTLPLVAVLVTVREHHAGPGPVSGAGSDGERRAGPAGRPVFAMAGLGFLVAGSAEMLTNLFPIIATEYAGLTTAQAGTVYAVSAGVAIAAGPVFGWLSDRVSRRLVLLVRGVANVLSSTLLLLFPGFAGVAVARSLDDLGKAAFRPTWGALMAQVASLDRCARARAMSLMGMGEDAGGVLGPILAGVLWSTWGIGALVAGRVLLAFASEAYALLVAPVSPRRLAAPAAGPDLEWEADVDLDWDVDVDLDPAFELATPIPSADPREARG